MVKVSLLEQLFDACLVLCPPHTGGDGHDVLGPEDPGRNAFVFDTQRFTHGFLKGTNNKQLVDGTFPKSRGVYLGRVERVLRDAVICRIDAPLKRGDGIVFDAGDPTKKEEGGRVYDLRRQGVKIEGEAQEAERPEEGAAARTSGNKRPPPSTGREK